MRKVLYALAILLSIVALVGVVNFSFTHIPGAKAATICTPTGFIRDGIDLTAAVIPTAANPNVTGPVDATGCNIGVYYGPGLTGSVSAAQIHSANYFGIVNNGSAVKITGSRVYEIGETPFNGTQHGVAVYFAYGSHATGTISSNLIWDYQKGGIVVNGVGTKATINHNTVIGQGPINYIAQNGIQVGFGAKATVSNNLVSGNSYTGAGQTASGGIIVVGGSCYNDSLSIGSKISNNTVMDNDVGVWLSNIDVDGSGNCVPPLTPTNIIVNKNISTNNYVNNTTGAGTSGYQAGIADQGDFDQITNNTICGAGYTDNPTPPPFLFSIDVTATNNPTVTGNKACDGSTVPATSAIRAPHVKHHAKASLVK